MQCKGIVELEVPRRNQVCVYVTPFHVELKLLNNVNGNVCL